MASGPDKTGTCQNCQMVRVRQTSRRGIREELACYVSLSGHRLKPGGWPVAMRTRSLMRRGTSERGFSPSQGGRGESLRRSHGDIAGTKSDASFGKRSACEHGNCPAVVPGLRASSSRVGIGTPSAEHAGQGGAAVVLGGREGRQRFREEGMLQCRKMRR